MYDHNVLPQFVFLHHWLWQLSASLLNILMFADLPHAFVDTIIYRRE
ncbi:MAG: hypothetical protein AAB209_10035 [Bacteroidota bacterium]